MTCWRRGPFDSLSQQVGPQLIGRGLAHQPKCVLSQPPVGRAARLIQLELVLHQEAQPVCQLPLQRLLRCSQRSIRITSQLLRYGGLVCLHDDFAEDPGVLVLPREQVDQLSPQLWKATEPVECSARKQLVDE